MLITFAAAAAAAIFESVRVVTAAGARIPAWALRGKFGAWNGASNGPSQARGFLAVCERRGSTNQEGARGLLQYTGSKTASYVAR